MTLALAVVLGYILATVLLSWLYFRRYRVARPPLGTINLWDVGVIMGGVILLPVLYIVLPAWVAASLLGLAFLGVLSVASEPVVRVRAVRWTLLALLLGGDIMAARVWGAASPGFDALNDSLLALAAVSVANLWAQSGMTARAVALLGGLLAIYDMVATAWLPLTATLIARLAGLPFAPLIGWGAGRARLGVGVGDLLLMAVFPLVMHKAFGRRAGLLALASVVGVAGGVLAVLAWWGLPATVPTMVVLGPLMLLHYAWWVRHRGGERTTWQYLRAEPLPL